MPVTRAGTTGAAIESDADREIAAVDLGSNSFHLVVARQRGREVVLLDRHKETVRLAAGLTAEKQLDPEAEQRALACLERLGQRLRHLPKGQVRAVGTNTLRRAANANVFLARAEAALGHPIDIIAGREEARLIYLGVVHTDGGGIGRRLVVDIGGGSTELIIGEGLEPIELESVGLGCVVFTQRFFNEGRWTAQAVADAVTAARLELRSLEYHYRRLGWGEAIGSSGSAKALAAVSTLCGFAEAGITAQSMQRIGQALTKAGGLDKLSLAGLSEDRKPVFAAGYAIMQAVFDALHLTEMRVSEGALREGLLFDMVGGAARGDVRSNTVQLLEQRYGLDRAHAQRVGATSLALFDAVAAAWDLGGEEREQLELAARLHELGLVISHSKYHEHGAYLLQHADLAGFTRHEQARMAALVRMQRRKLKLRELAPWLPPSPVSQQRLLRLVALLRLGILLHRDRSPRLHLPEIGCEAAGNSIRLEFPQGWLKQHPLTEDDLVQEADMLKAAGITLSAI